MANPRRTSVANRPGIYYHETSNGQRRYEISYTDSDGRRRWKTVEGDLKAAQKARADISTRIDKGERVAPTRATIAEVAPEALAAAPDLRPRTRERYESALATHVLPRLGRVRVSELRKHHVAGLIASMRSGVYYVRQDERGKLVPASQEGRLVAVNHGRPAAGWTIRGTLSPLSLIMEYAIEEGMAAANPVAQLRGGKGRRSGLPPVSGREMRTLERDEIPRLLKAAPDRYRALLATAVFTGLRLGELLGLTWADVDLEAGFVRVQKQLGRSGERVEPKTKQAKRDVVIFGALGKVLAEHKLRSGFSQPGDFVFASDSEAGMPLQPSNVRRRGLAKAVADAGLDGEGRPKLRWHDLRHTAASLLIAEGLDVVFVSRQLGHANPSITLSVYAHLFDRVRHAERTRDALEASFGTLVEHAAGEGRLAAAGAASGEVAQLRELASGG
jgi:integrase